jgi:TRAP-type C4-dicarboxylate transport system permease small subunit
MVVDVAGRYLFNRPLSGGYEVVELLMIPTALMAVAYCQEKRGHLTMEFAIDRLPPRPRAGFEFFNTIVTFGLYLFMAIWLLLSAIAEIGTGRYSGLLKVPIYPFKFVAAISMFAMTLELVLTTVTFFSIMVGKSSYDDITKDVADGTEREG